MSTIPKPDKRTYNIADAYMIEFAKDTHTNATDDLADFTAFDPDLDAAFLLAFDTAITDAEAVPSDDQVQDVITQLTEDMESAMGACRDKFQNSKYFIEKAFPDNKAVWNEMGYDRYLAARDNQPKLIEFMTDFGVAATKHAAVLATVNFTPALLAEIGTLTEALNNSNKIQNAYIGNRQSVTSDRLTKHNAVWKTAVQLCTVGKIVYQNNYAKYQRYLLPSTEEAPGVLAFIGTVTTAATPANTGNPAPIENVEVTVENAEVSVTVLTDSDGKFGIGGLASNDYTVRFMHPNYMPETRSITIVEGETLTLDVELMPAELPPNV